MKSLKADYYIMNEGLFNLQIISTLLFKSTFL